MDGKVRNRSWWKKWIRKGSNPESSTNRKRSEEHETDTRSRPPEAPTAKPDSLHPPAGQGGEHPIRTWEQNVSAYASFRRDTTRPFSNLPLTLQVELTDACNLKCRKCNRTYLEQEDGFMSEEQLEAVFDMARTSRSIYPFGFGESLLFPGVAEVLGRFKQLGNQVALLTNGMLLDRKMVEAMILNGVDGVGISLDATSPELLSELRKGADFDRITGHVNVLNELKKTYDVHHPLLGFNVVVENSNFHELEKIVELAEEWNVYFINFTPMASPDHLEEHEIEKLDPGEDALERLDHFQKMAKEKGIHINMGELRLILEKKSPASIYDGVVSCPEPFHIMCVGAKGDIYPCCRWDRAQPFGRFPDTDLKSAWMNDAWTRLRKDVLEGSYPEPCLRCMKNFSRPRGDSNLELICGDGSA